MVLVVVMPAITVLGVRGRMFMMFYSRPLDSMVRGGVRMYIPGSI
jgi:hypothetical protein